MVPKINPSKILEEFPILSKGREYSTNGSLELDHLSGYF